MPTRIKFCGITRPEDAAAAVAVGASAVGMVFVPGTPRFVTLERAREIAATIPPFVSRVGLFVDAPEATILEAIAFVGIDTVQLHGAETPEFAQSIRMEGRVRVIKAFRIRDAASLDAVHAHASAADAWLLDAYVEGAAGGTGMQFDWSLAHRIKALPKPVIIAGGLKPENVAEAIRLFRPYAVDVSSGVEAGPGIKDGAKLAAFASAVLAGDI
jgi:phosphoribosylanthranilate isomerase